MAELLRQSPSEGGDRPPPPYPPTSPCFCGGYRSLSSDGKDTCEVGRGEELCACRVAEAEEGARVGRGGGGHGRVVVVGKNSRRQQDVNPPTEAACQASWRGYRMDSKGSTGVWHGGAMAGQWLLVVGKTSDGCRLGTAQHRETGNLRE